MAEKKLNARIISKHELEKDWESATNFVPMLGEIIIYDKDSTYTYERMKIGDGEKNVNALPFVDDALRATLLEEISAVDDKVDALNDKVIGLVGEDETVSQQIHNAAIANQSDWAVNDETSPAYIKNRPFYTTDVENKELANGTLTFQQYTDEVVATVIDCNATSIEVGQEISVTFEANQYTLAIKKAGQLVVAGNASIINYIYGTTYEDTNELVCLVFTEGRCLLMALSQGLEHFVAVTVPSSTIYKIPNKYLDLNIKNGDGQYSIAEGHSTIASGSSSHAEGSGTTAEGISSHAEGYSSKALGDYAHAEGYFTTASKAYAHAEGYNTEATGDYGAHAEGYFGVASGNTSHAEGSHTVASGNYSHAEGARTTAASDYQHVQGWYNIADNNGKYLHIVGNGNKNGPVYSNAHTLDWHGNAWFQGTVKIGGTGQDDNAAKVLATQEYVNSAIAEIPTPDVSGQISAHNTSNSAHSDIRTSINNVSTLVGNTAVGTQIGNHNTSNTAHNDIRTAINNVSNLVGGTAVSTQIENALVAITNDEIDAICGAAIYNASEVKF